jgi:hypothetical protein
LLSAFFADISSLSGCEDGHAIHGALLLAAIKPAMSTRQPHISVLVQRPFQNASPAVALSSCPRAVGLG